MLLHLAKRLSEVRHYQFVGRTYELDLFNSLLVIGKLPFNVLHVIGPGGVGKTALLREFARLCEQNQKTVFYLDAHNTEPLPESFLSALGSVLSLNPSDSPLHILASRPDRQIILIDTYERIALLDQWLREVFLPQLSQNTLIVLAGCHSPLAAWRTDPGWQTLSQTLVLRNLSPEESRTYLTRQQIPLTQHQAVLNFTHGHPLALSLVIDVFAQGREIRFQPEAVPDVVKTLLKKFVQKISNSSHRMALDACALVRLTTEPLLAELLKKDDVGKLFEWLRELSFIELGRAGLFPPDFAREVLTTDLRWRNPDWFIELHLRARTYYKGRLKQTQGQEQQRLLFDYMFLHRYHPAVKSGFAWQDSDLASDDLHSSDLTALFTMVAQHEGEDSARLAEYWMARQPQGVQVLRDAEHKPVGLVMMVALHQASIEELNADPAASAAWHYLQQHTPLRQNEAAILFRFWMARDTYQAVSSAQSLIFVNFVQYHWLKAGLAFSFITCAEPDFWADLFAYAYLKRLPEADFEVGGRRYGVYGNDWRVVSATAWQELLAHREITAPTQVISPLQVSEPLVVLSQPKFAEAVRDALRHFFRPHLLEGNPLLQSRLVVERVAAPASRSERIAALQALVKEVAESLQSLPDAEKCYRTLYYTYLHQETKQEQAAELLDLPFSTFRRYLKAAVMQVINILWQWEVRSLQN